MPTYQYACTACEHRFEAVQSFSDAALSECPECTGRLRKLYGSVGVVFKGSGFYRNDSRSGSSSASSTTTPATPAKTESKSESSTSASSTPAPAAKSDTAAKAS
ncbi:putative FmdB family regulatory protein [Actinokineospora baliensis]|uniref:FmdB family zinc ribbon protein n=1 Tax=Actinokineospora baliensis TaxID=547056 RepID=UPI00195CFACD|nr:FmdB family zinc ribbon protein [Actinokineospora baliensis]MBM7771710.1 putative FmdB family regulatory protein [Actinokineospora baliensis]